MVGYPKHLNTKEDYEYVRTNFPKEQWKADFQDLLDSRCDWFNDGVVEGQGITDDTHKVVTDTQENKSYQYVYKDNPSAKIHQIGYTVDEVTNIINGK